MAEGIWKLDDGSIYYFDADSKDHARFLWAQQLTSEGYATAEDIARDFDEPEISRVHLAEAAKVEVTTDDYGPCSKCDTPQKEPIVKSLLEVWQDEQHLSPTMKANHGVLCNSEWP